MATRSGIRWASVLAAGILVTIGSGCESVSTETDVTVSSVCLSTVPHADHENGEYDALVGIYGALGYSDGVWSDATGRVIGTSLAEDSAICVIRPVFATGAAVVVP